MNVLFTAFQQLLYVVGLPYSNFTYLDNQFFTLWKCLIKHIKQINCLCYQMFSTSSCLLLQKHWGRSLKTPFYLTLCSCQDLFWLSSKTIAERVWETEKVISVFISKVVHGSSSVQLLCKQKFLHKRFLLIFLPSLEQFTVQYFFLKKKNLQGLTIKFKINRSATN